MPAVITAENGVSFRESILFTHRGLSGPAVLQLSSYWQPGEFVSVNLLPTLDLAGFLNEQRQAHPNQSLKNTLALHLPKRLVECLQTLGQLPEATLKQLNPTQQAALVETLQNWRVQPNGTEGYRTAEVTLGGVDTKELSSKTMEAAKVPGLYFIGEVVDVTGWLGDITSSGPGVLPGLALRRWRLKSNNFRRGDVKAGICCVGRNRRSK